MSVLVVGLSYRTAPLELLERVSFQGDTLAKGLHQLRLYDSVGEGVILSTCNRVEVYALVSGFHAGLATLRRFFSEAHHVGEAELGDRLYAHYDDDAARHLFGVAAGIDSMVVGEPQILSQVREAFRVASDEDATGPILSALFRQAIRVGRRARNETQIAGLGATFAMAGATLARRELGTLDGRTIVLLGAGKMTTMSARAIAREGARIVVANRTPSRAESLAQRIGASTVSMHALRDAIADADLVIASTGADLPVVTHELVADAMRSRPHRPLVLLDLALPRDVEPSCAEIDGVVVRDLDALRSTLEPTASQRAEIERVREIVENEVPKFVAWQRAHGFAPLMAALQQKAEEIRVRAVRRAAAKLGDLDEAQRETLDALTRSIVAKLLHEPLTRVKAAAGTPEGEVLARALREMFGLET